MFSKLVIYIHSSWNWAYYIHLVDSKTKANDIKHCNLLAWIDQTFWSLCIPVCVFKTLCLNRCRRSMHKIKQSINHISQGRKKAGLDVTSEDGFRPIPRLISYSGVMGDAWELLCICNKIRLNSMWAASLNQLCSEVFMDFQGLTKVCWCNSLWTQM